MLSVKRLMAQVALHQSHPRIQYLLIATVACIGLYLISQSRRDVEPHEVVVGDSEGYKSALRKRASKDNFILLALVDSAFVDMALNLYYTSLRPHNIECFLFVGACKQACEILTNHSLPCFHYTDDEDSNEASRYLSKSFLRKMNIRTHMILEALRAGYTVLHTDLDVVFIANPIPELKKQLATGDIALLQDTSVHNAGFLVVKPNQYGIEVYSRIKSITDKSPTTDDQTALNSVVGSMQELYTAGEFTVIKLNPERYVCGLAYFERQGRMFAGDRPCQNCIVVHNNWIVSREAKVYRFKEHHMWMYDKGLYYTNLTRLYLIYDNPLENWDSDASATEAELNALKAALTIGKMTKRIVILPRFHCGVSHIKGTSIPMNGFTSPRRIYKQNATNSINGKRYSYSSQRISNTSLYNNSVEASNTGSSSRSRVRMRSQNPMRDCPLNALLDMAAFDAEFEGLYLESSFLTHPLVNIPITHYTNPQLILTYSSRKLLRSLVPNFSLNITEDSSNQIYSQTLGSETVEFFWPPSLTEDNSIVTEQNIIERYVTKHRDDPNNYPPRVLVFHSLYSVNPVFINATLGEEFDSRITRAFKRRTYRQY